MRDLPTAELTSLLNGSREPSSRGEVNALVGLCQKGVREGKEELCRQFARFVYQMVLRQTRGQGDENDYFQEGILGLLRAAESYRPYHPQEAQFITYAAFWIRAYIQKARAHNCLVKRAEGPLPREAFASLSEKDWTRDLKDESDLPDRALIRQETSRLVAKEVRSLGLSRREKAILEERLLQEAGLKSLAAIGRTFRLSRETIRLSENKVKVRIKSRLRSLASGG